VDLRERIQSALGIDYLLQRELGGGGMSRVYLARDDRLGRDVVVKVLSPELAESLSLDRFERELRIAARLQHPNIVPVLVAGNSDGLPYYTMPFVRGESLRARLTAGRVPVRETLRLLRDVAHALAYAHAEGVIHRDIKPETVLIAGWSVRSRHETFSAWCSRSRRCSTFRCPDRLGQFARILAGRTSFAASVCCTSRPNAGQRFRRGREC
jgi:serine/threonine-protein kinase